MLLLSKKNCIIQFIVESSNKAGVKQGFIGRFYGILSNLYSILFSNLASSNYVQKNQLIFHMYYVILM